MSRKTKLFTKNDTHARAKLDPKMASTSDVLFDTL